MTRRIRRAVKGVSPVLATLILIVVAVIAGLVVYWWVMGQFTMLRRPELKIMNVWWETGSWSNTKVGTTQDTGTADYDLWSVGYKWYYIKPGSMEVYVYDENDKKYTLEESSWKLYYDADEDGKLEGNERVGDVWYYDGKISINYDTLKSLSGANFVDGKDVRVKCEWRRIELRIKNTGDVDVSITKLWVGYSKDCPWDWSDRVKFTSFPYRITAGSDIRFYITSDWTAGKDYYFKFEVDGEYLGPYGPYRAS